MALVTLRKGPKEGAYILLWMALPSVALVAMGYPMFFIYSVLCGSLVSWLLAVLLRSTQSWSVVLQLGTLLCLVVVIAIHGVVPDIGHYWYDFISKYYKDAERTLTLPITAADLKELIRVMAKIATGAQAVILLFVALVNLVLARGWQAILFNPQGLKRELYNIRLGSIAAATLAAIFAATFMRVTLAWDLLPVILALFFAAGISLIHFVATKTKATWGLLLVFYGLLIFLFPYVGTLVIALAIVDAFVDLRGRFNRQMA